MSTLTDEIYGMFVRANWIGKIANYGLPADGYSYVRTATGGIWLLNEELSPVQDNEQIEQE